MRIYMSLKVYILPTLKLIFVQAVLNTVSSISNVHSLYQCSCKQCCDIAVYAMCYSIINPCGYWTSGTLSAQLLVMGIHSNTVQCDGCEKTYNASWSSWKWEYQWNWDKPHCLRCTQWCPMLQFGWEKICVEDVHFKTLSWSDRIFVVDWNILCKLCSSAKKTVCL